MLITEAFSPQLDDLLVRICSDLQITPTQHRVAEDRYNAIGNWLEAKEARSRLPSLSSIRRARFGSAQPCDHSAGKSTTWI